MAATKPGRHSDGDNLYLNVSKSGTKSWVFLWRRDGRIREMGLGSLNAMPLKKAREEAAKARAHVTAGRDPIEARDAGKQAERGRNTFGQCADALIEAQESGWLNAKHGAQWRSTLETYAAPLRSRPIDEIDTAAVLKVLQPLWLKKPETASRLRGRIEAVLDYAKAQGHRQGEPDLTGVRTTAGDFNEADLSEACDRKEIVGNIVSTWFAKGANRTTLCYAVDRNHARHLQERFIEAGVSAEYIDCDTPMFEREEIFERFRASETKIICNAEGKDYCVILDHAGNHKRLGLVTEIDFPNLDCGEPGKAPDRAAAAKAPTIKLCPECHCVLPPQARACPACGEPILACTPVIEKAGELVEFGSGRTGNAAMTDEFLWHGALVRIGRQKGYAPGWASHQFKTRFGRWPMLRYPPEREPTIEIKNWVRLRAIAFAKARQAHG